MLNCKKSFPSAFCLVGSLGAVQRLLRGGRGYLLPLTCGKMFSVDLIISSLGLHWTNDLPGSMIQVLLLLLVVVVELRIACTLAHIEREGGISPRLTSLAQVIYMTGWREHSSQPQAKRRGSATVSFTDIQKQFGA
ncbi:hypothetical protein HID58_025833 [Brassica napus]|uniref:Uncharacterized protein n=1 Tax=Brassica napus TaxID=3708 RepID=A0ABQ8CNM6_BRANA|nr:hypothetical protein HID58_025833 [Brassica napus]